MKILAIETSCDETSAAVIEKKEKQQFSNVLSNITASSLKLHKETGGIIPERAAREQIKYIIPTIIESLLKSKEENQNLSKEKKFEEANKILKNEINAIAVTVGPGLIGSLLIGVETAKTLSFSLNKPIIPVNHLLGHIYANFIDSQKSSNIKFPFISLIVSGGHTDLLLFKSHQSFKWLGGTRDDAAGEAMDKIARILGIGYPGGPEIEKRAKKGKFKFTSPLIDSDDFDFSFSGLKTQVAREIKKIGKLDEQIIDDICFAVQKAIIDVLVKKTIKAAQEYNAKSILISGGVSANEKLREEFKLKIENLKLKIPFFAPEKKLSTDNAAMIGTTAFFQGKPTSWNKINANPELYFQ